MTTDALPHIGFENGIRYCAGCNGSGVATMTYLGLQIARRILNGGKSDNGYATLTFPEVPVPFYRGNPWFLPFIGQYYRHLDKKDRRTA